jgi:hypothetical protein
MNQLHPRQDDSGRLASTRSGITRQDLLGKARHLANRQQPKAGGVLTPAAADPGYDEAPRSWSQRC